MPDGSYATRLDEVVRSAYVSFSQCLGSHFSLSALGAPAPRFDEFCKLLVVAFMADGLDLLSPPFAFAEGHARLSRAAALALRAPGTNLETAIAEFESSLGALWTAVREPGPPPIVAFQPDGLSIDSIETLYQRISGFLLMSGRGRHVALLGRYFDVDSAGVVRWRAAE